MSVMPAWGTPAEIENRRRLRLAAAAYAYENMSVSIMSDATFDSECRDVDLTMDTAYPHWDAWWRKHFDPSTGVWIHQHPDQDGLHRLVTRIYLLAPPTPLNELEMRALSAPEPSDEFDRILG